MNKHPNTFLLLIKIINVQYDGLKIKYEDNQIVSNLVWIYLMWIMWNYSSVIGYKYRLANFIFLNDN